MAVSDKRLFLCNCERTMRLDPKRLAQALGTEEPFLHSHLCTAQIDSFRRALAEDRPVLVCCTQETPLFDEVAAEADKASAVAYVNIRERAGWGEQGPSAIAKMTALIAEAAIEIEPTPAVTLKSEGVALVYGDKLALEAARRLSGRLDVTCVLEPPVDLLPPKVMEMPLFCGKIRKAAGHLGAFEVTLDGFASYLPSAREALAFGPPSDGAVLTCDVILDLSGDAPLFASAAKREGYFRAEPSDLVQVHRKLFDIADMVGEFEKPRYVRLDPGICAHSRNRIVGCTNCLNVCPTGAIAPNGDSVAVSSDICIGHGACASVCPTGAIRFDLPSANAVFERLRVLIGTYLRAGGQDLVLLVHDPDFGDDVIGTIARLGRGLPANVVPFAVHSVLSLGLDFILTALAYGAAQVRVLAGPEIRDQLAPLLGHAAIVEAVMVGLGFEGGRVVIEEEDDPARIEAGLFAPPPAALAQPAKHMVMGGKRTALSLALERLYAAAPRTQPTITLPAGAPFGRVLLNDERCTLCLACVAACPTSALGDNPEKPQLTFTEVNCVQCGLCRATCPEGAIALEPRLSFAQEAKARIVLKEEEPFCCVRCGKPFGNRTTIERLIGRLAGHPMFLTEERRELLRMCDDCRVAAQFEDRDTPFAFGTRPRPRTTDDYLRAREQRVGRFKEKESS